MIVMERWILRFVALLYAAPGTLFLLFPREMAGWMRFAVLTGTAATDLRAVFGGLELGLACFFAWSAQDIRRHATALVAALATLGGMALSRVGGMIADGGVGWENPTLLGLEVLGIVVVAWGLRRARRRGQRHVLG